MQQLVCAGRAQGLTLLHQGDSRSRSTAVALYEFLAANWRRTVRRRSELPDSRAISGFLLTRS